MILALLLLFAADPPRAQLSGVIRDATGAVLVQATVTAQNEESGARRTVESGPDGAFLIPGLAAGPHKVTVRKPGFQTIARLNYPLAPGDSAALDFTMHVGSVREVIVITGDPATVNVDDGSVGTSIGRHLLDEIPSNGRALHSIVDLAPGVVSTPAAAGEAGQFATGGQRPNTNYFTIDGVSANTGAGGGGLPAQFWGGSLPAMTAFGSTHNLVAFDGLEEVRVQTSTYSPEFGRMPGAHVAVTTRAGTNDLHGSLFYSLRHEALAAQDWFARARALPDTPLRFHHAGTSAGGPLRRNRTFFHATWEALRLTQPFTFQTVVPTPDQRRRAPERYRGLLDAFPLPNGPESTFTAALSRPARADSGSLRIDHALTSRVTLFGRYNQAPSSSDSGFLQTERSSLGFRSLTAGATSVHSPVFSSEFRLNFSSASASSSWRRPGLASLAPQTIHAFSIGGIGDLIDGEGARNRQGQLNLTGTLAWNASSHAVRAGFDYQRLTPERERATTGIATSFRSLDDLLAGLEPLTAEARAGQASTLIEMLSLFFQDTWRPNPRLSVTYGARWEITPPPSRRGATALPAAGPLWSTRYGQVAPRIGAAYRLTPRTVVRGGWGLFYDLGFSAAADPINGYPFNRWQFGSTVTSLPGAGPPETAVPGFAPNLQLPRSHHWNAAVEHAFTEADLLSVSWVGSAGRKLLRREGELRAGTRAAESIVSTNHGESIYHAMQAHYRRRFARRLQATASYTWSHAIDNGSWDSALVLPGAGQERATSAFDTRHAAAAALSYELRGWRIGSVLRARTGFPVDVLTAANSLGLGFDNITRPDLVPGVPLWLSGRRLNPAAFRVPAGLQGTLGRNSIPGFGMWQADASVSRRLRLSERAGLDLRVDAFNVLNRASFADPVRFLDHRLFGTSPSMLNLMLGSGSPRSGLAPGLQTGGPRTVQATLRFTF